jgi:hypothetical protein
MPEAAVSYRDIKVLNDLPKMMATGSRMGHGTAQIGRSVEVAVHEAGGHGAQTLAATIKHKVPLGHGSSRNPLVDWRTNPDLKSRLASTRGLRILEESEFTTARKEVFLMPLTCIGRRERV